MPRIVNKDADQKIKITQNKNNSRLRVLTDAQLLVKEILKVLEEENKVEERRIKVLDTKSNMASILSNYSRVGSGPQYSAFRAFKSIRKTEENNFLNPYYQRKFVTDSRDAKIDMFNEDYESVSNCSTSSNMRPLNQARPSEPYSRVETFSQYNNYQNISQLNTSKNHEHVLKEMKKDENIQFSKLEECQLKESSLTHVFILLRIIMQNL